MHIALPKDFKEHDDEASNKKVKIQAHKTKLDNFLRVRKVTALSSPFPVPHAAMQATLSTKKYLGVSMYYHLSQ